MYRVGLEAIFGFDRRGSLLPIRPCVPDAWGEYLIQYRFRGTVYAITVHQPGEVCRLGAEVSVDGRVLGRAEIELADDGGRHEVLVRPRLVSPVAE